MRAWNLNLNLNGPISGREGVSGPVGDIIFKVVKANLHQHKYQFLLKLSGSFKILGDDTVGSLQCLLGLFAEGEKPDKMPVI